jgi:hypothetical protein
MAASQAAHDLLGLEAGNVHALGARARTGCNGNRTASDVKRGGKEGDQRGVGRALDRRRIQPHEQGLVARSGELSPGGAGNHANGEFGTLGSSADPERQCTLRLETLAQGRLPSGPSHARPNEWISLQFRSPARGSGR